MERTVERLLGGVRVVERMDLGSSDLAPVARLFLDRSYDGIGRTVIAKGRRLTDVGWGRGSEFLRNERLALDHLRGTGLAPVFLASSVDEPAPHHEQVVVLTDLGPGPTVQELLFGDDPMAATEGLLAMARLAGALHGTVDPEFAAAHEVQFLDHPLDLWRPLTEAAAELGFPPPGDVELADLAGELRRHTTFTHGDFTPNNVVLVDGEARLVDLEGAGRRHPGMDAACLRLPFPQYGHWAVLPDHVLARMDRAYRAALAPMEDSAYERMMATGCAAWAIVRASRLRLIASTDQDSVEAVRRRTQIVQTLTSAAVSAMAVYPRLCTWFEELAGAMQLRWEETRQPPRGFQAFKDFPNQ
ncbi:phosphotransferase [Kribbella sp. NPDC023972]|uniref:phosphotransferase family protein n=1 Tax=Kribbella sp. NPDC023972 TaxID=3154795 RepID=UPI0033E6FBDB